MCSSDLNVMFREKDGICYAISLDRYEYYAGQLCMAFARCFRSKKLRHGFVLFLGRDEDDE